RFGSGNFKQSIYSASRSDYLGIHGTCAAGAGIRRTLPQPHSISWFSNPRPSTLNPAYVGALMERCVAGIAAERTSFISFRARIVDYSGFRLRAESGAGEVSGDRRWSVVGHTALRRHAELTARVSHRTRTRVFVWLAVDADRRRHAFYCEVSGERAVSHYS